MRTGFYPIPRVSPLCLSPIINNCLLLVPAASINENWRLSVWYDAPCLFPACPVMYTPISPCRSEGCYLRRLQTAIADRHANFRAATAEMSRAGVFCASRRLIQSKCGTAWSSTRALSYLHLPLVNLLFQPRFFYTSSPTPLLHHRLLRFLLAT